VGQAKKRKVTSLRADRFDLYQQSIQGPEIVQFLDRRFRILTGRAPRVFREDFCGTAFNCCEFVRLHPENRAIGVDLDESALRWCLLKNYPRLTDKQLQSITLLQGDVLTISTSKVDLVAALNFSYSVFKTRPFLLTYLKNVRKSLKKEGVLMLDVNGGPDVLSGDTYRKKTKEFVYICEGDPVDAITHDAKVRIHFQFPDKSVLRNAFVYDWRLWTLPELIELLEEAGFRNVHVLWQRNVKTNSPTGVFRRASSAGGVFYRMWVAYVAAQA
jgi:SAM-dependent methyltransferase